ncbi:MAG TPA: tape measure protein [Pseudolabrys sp.]|nr:tape measure protein [Pseudolabrys sp.]
MADDLEQMVLSISADTRQIMRALKKLEADSGASTKKIEKQFDDLGKKVDGTFAGLGKRVSAGLAGAFSIREAQRLIDSATRIDNALKVAGLSGEELSKVYDGLFRSAQKNAAPLEALVTLYGRAAMVQKDLGVSTEELLRFTDNISTALRVSGRSAQESSGALLQLSQALGSGVVRAQEFNSMLEGALPIVQAAAAGIEEAGGSVSKLRQLVNDGKVSSAAFFRGFEAGAVLLNTQVAGASLTVAQGFERLQNAAVDAAKRINETTGASRSATDILDTLAFVVMKLAGAFEQLGKSRGGTDRIDELGAAARNLWNDPSFQNLYEFLFDASKSPAKSAARDAIDARVQGIEALADAMRKANVEVTAAKKATGASKFDDAFAAFSSKKISLNDFAVPDKDKDKKNTVGVDSFERAVAAAQKRIEVQKAETAVIDQGVAARERAKLVAELETAAKAANTAAGMKNAEVTAQQRATIDQMADAMFRSAQAAEAANSPLRAFAREAADTNKQLENAAVSGLREFEDSLMSVIDGSKSAEDAFRQMTASILNDIARIILRATVLGPIAKGMSGLFGFSEGGPVPGFDAGGFTGVGGKYQPAGVVHKGEYVFDADATRRIGVPNLERLRRSFATGGYVGNTPSIVPSGAVSISYSPVYNVAQGADPKAIDELRRAQAEDRAAFKVRAVQAIKEAQSRRGM